MRFPVLIAAVTLIACGKPRAPEPARAPSTEMATRGHGAMPQVKTTSMIDELKQVGLDVKNLPPIESLDRQQKLRVMKTFTESLGIVCMDCHSEDFAADTKRKRVAKRMFNEFVRVLSMENGDAVYCDSCHQGSLYTLDRSDKTKIADYMNDVFVGKLKRADDRSHACATCHGDPADFKLLTTWKSSVAPNIEVAGGLPASREAL